MKEARARSVKKMIKIGLIALAIGAALGVGVAFTILHVGATFEDLDKLKTHRPKTFTRVYDRKGRIIDIFSSEKRIVLDYDDIPTDFVHALVAVEDEDFFNHIGVSPWGILSAMKDNLLTDGRRGASTITQQLVKNITQDTRNSYARKIKEQFLAVQLETVFTKQEIFAMYANEVALGNNQFGIETAARFYFGKSVGALSLEECAALAGIPNGPSRFNPYRNPEACTKRRNHVIDRMCDEGYVTREKAQAAKAMPLVLVDRKKQRRSPVAAHFVDFVREYLFSRYGEERVRTEGWDIHTTLDLDYQRTAEACLRRGLKVVDKRQGYRPWDCPSVFKGKNADQEGILEDYFDPSWHTPLQDGVSLRGVIMKVSEDTAEVRIRDTLFELHEDGLEWTRQSNLTRLFKVGDVPQFRVKRLADLATKGEGEPQEAEPRFSLILDQEPLVEGAFMVQDPSSGDILAMVGGYDYARSKFNKAIQAERQVGSAFKPVVYGSAFEQGFTLSDQLFDEPTVFIDPSLFYIDENDEIKMRPRKPEIERAIRLGLIPAPEVYEPRNYYLKYAGKVTLRQALAESKNIVAVKLLNAVGYDHALDYAYRLGLDDIDLQPYPSMALGAFEMSLADLCTAYGTFALSGVRFDPRSITLIIDPKGQIIEQNLPRGEQVISPENAYLVTSALRSVIEDRHGTGHSAARLGLPLAGKTGTTDDYTDAWFVGLHPTLVAGVWVGHEEKKRTIGKNATGGSTALPIWIDFFEKIKDQLRDVPFPEPEGIVKMPVDKLTGKRLTNDCTCSHKNKILEVYIKGTEPTEICVLEEQESIELPWFLQKKVYEFDPTTGGIEPARVLIDYASQKRALALMAQKNEARKNQVARPNAHGTP